MTSPSIYFSDCRAFPKCPVRLMSPLSCNSPGTDPKRSESFRISFYDGFDDLFQKHQFLRQLMSIATMISFSFWTFDEIRAQQELLSCKTCSFYNDLSTPVSKPSVFTMKNRPWSVLELICFSTISFYDDLWGPFQKHQFLRWIMSAPQMACSDCLRR